MGDSRKLLIASIVLGLVGVAVVLWKSGATTPAQVILTGAGGGNPPGGSTSGSNPPGGSSAKGKNTTPGDRAPVGGVQMPAGLGDSPRCTMLGAMGLYDAECPGVGGNIGGRIDAVGMDHYQLDIVSNPVAGAGVL